MFEMILLAEFNGDDIRITLSFRERERGQTIPCMVAPKMGDLLHPNMSHNKM